VADVTGVFRATLDNSGTYLTFTQFRLAFSGPSTNNDSVDDYVVLSTAGFTTAPYLLVTYVIP
jgi:hypothetical protein